MRTDYACRGWDSETRYRRLLDDLIPLDLGGWRLPEVRAALSTLGWKIRPVGPGEGVPGLARGRRPEVAWVLDHPPRGPRQGVGVLTMAADDAEQVLGVEVNLSYGIAYDDDHAHELHFAQTAREVTEDVLGGPPTRLAGPGPRAVWIRPGADVGVTLDEGNVVLPLLRTDRGAEFRRGYPDVWRGSLGADPSRPEPSRPVRDWADAGERLGTGDRPRGPIREAVSLLVDAVRALEMDLADLTYSGEVAVPTSAGHLELPQLGLPRAVPEGAAGA
ncbi:hypothetical protein ACFV6M_08465 [Streptomyces californicus]|uniref:hypothetical protein n=1 Tax=Streptomyces californicus TaxID=67351 RepID=UPI003649C098